VLRSWRPAYPAMVDYKGVDLGQVLSLRPADQAMTLENYVGGVMVKSASWKRGGCLDVSSWCLEYQTMSIWICLLSPR